MTRARILADYVSGGTTAAEFDYMDGVTSNVQTQMDLKAPITNAALVTPNLGTPSAGVMTNMTGAVEASLVDNAVTLAKMAGGTDGNLITYDTSGDPAYVATGTSGHVLTSAGADAVPAFAAVPASGGITHLTTVTLSGSSSTGTGTRTLFSDTYESYWIVISSARITTDTGEVRMRYSTDASTDLTNIYYNTEAQGRSDDGTVRGFAYDDLAYIELNTNQKVGPKTTGFSFVINGARDSNAFTVMHGSGHSYPGGNYHFGFQMSALYEDTPTISGFNLYAIQPDQSADDFAGGICSVFGIKES
jgi:hypothetical protein